MPTDTTIPLLERLEAYQRKLLQLGRRNRCVCLARIYKKHSFDLYHLLESHSKRIDVLIAESFRRKKPVYILPDSDSSDVAIMMRTRLKELSRNIQKMEDETGSQYCYLGFPFLEGHITKNHYVRGPLVLFPASVKYERRGNGRRGWYIGFSGAPILNHTLFAALQKIGNYGTTDTLESAFEEIISSAESIKDPEGWFVESLSALLSNSGLPLAPSDTVHLVPASESNDSGAKTTIPLKDISKDEITFMERQPLRIANCKIIGSFPQGESAIYRDYEELISQTKRGGVGDFITDILGETTSTTDFGEDASMVDLDNTSDRDLNLILNSDSSQDMAVLSSQNQNVTLVRGPPGTGKSQVIVNMISNALSKGQTVLVVCQKRAALEVVHQRLAEKGLDRYTVLLNRESEDRKQMYRQLKVILDQADRYTEDRTGEIQTTSEQIDKLIKKHRDIAEALSEKHFGGVTVRDLYAKSSPNYRQRLNLRGIADNIHYHDLEHIRDSMSQVEDSFKRFEDQNHPWKNRTDFSQKGASDRDRIKETLSDILSGKDGYIIRSDPVAQNRLIDAADRYAEATSKKAEAESDTQKHTDSIRQMIEDDQIPWPPVDMDGFADRVEAGVALWDRFGDRQKILDVQGRHIAEGSREEQVYLINAFSEGETSRWKRLTDAKAQRRHKIREEFYKGPDVSGRSRADLKEMLDNGLELLALAEGHPFGRYMLKGAHLIGDHHRQKLLLQRTRDLTDAKSRLDRSLTELRDARQSLERNEGITLSADAGEDIRLASKAKKGGDILKAIDILSEFVTKEEIDAILRKAVVPEELLPHIRKMYEHADDFDEMQNHDARKAALTDMERDILSQCAATMDHGENWTGNVIEEIYRHWIGVIERKRSVLKAGHFEGYERNRTRLASLLEKKSEMVVDQIISKIESQASFRPGQGNRRTKREAEYNILSHELGKKRRVKPVRKLLESYEHILLDLAPCWLASPEMVSNVFPLDEIFDLIIVDEASQLAAERALPFLSRGSRLVIAGDEKQLKPNDLFQVAEEDVEDDVLNIESLLDLTARRYHTITLRWHYRSKWQELIDFSNHAFYSGSLQISPNSEKDSPIPPIEWVSCDAGLWENRANQAEADTVVDTLHRILKESQGKKPPTVGIITFNDQQRNMIMDRIDDRRRDDRDFDELYERADNPESGKKDEEIFVRNIENVQGDERDIIIFSVGYAKGHDGVLRLLFGSLNQFGGENRLNVAITRAGQKIIVVCSMNPLDMKTDGSKNPGPKRLRDFLIYARAVSKGDSEGARRVLDSLDSGMSIDRRKTANFDSEFEELVHDRLEGLGYQVDTQVGQSAYRIDLAVVHPRDGSRYILGIECDGATYHSAKSVRERDVMRQKFLERRGWIIERIWSRNWWRDPDREMWRIRERIESLVSE